MRFVNRFYISVLTAVIFLTFAVLARIGYTYYHLPLEERFFNTDHMLLKPGGIWGHAYGIFGTLFIILGIVLYMMRKRMRSMARFGGLKYWLEFHIFLCTLGSVFVLYHTTFKFGGIVSIGFWSMAIVWSSGVIGRYIYIQIPHSIEGRELTLLEIKDYMTDMDLELMNKYHVDISDIKSTNYSHKKLKLLSENIKREDFKKIKQLIYTQKKIGRRIVRLDRMQSLFKYWHVAHLPFALIMLIIMVIHIAVVLTFGYKWIF